MVGARQLRGMRSPLGDAAGDAVRALLEAGVNDEREARQLLDAWLDYERASRECCRCECPENVGKRAARDQALAGFDTMLCHVLNRRRAPGNTAAGILRRLGVRAAFLIDEVAFEGGTEQGS